MVGLGRVLVLLSELATEEGLAGLISHAGVGVGSGGPDGCAQREAEAEEDGEHHRVGLEEPMKAGASASHTAKNTSLTGYLLLYRRTRSACRSWGRRPSASGPQSRSYGYEMK